MRKLVHFLQGSIQIRVTGAFPERFLNLCGGEQLQFWDVKTLGSHELTVLIPGYCLSRARALAERAMCEVEPMERFGLPFFLYRFRSRYALIAGLLLALFGAITLSRFILVVNVTGNDRVSDSVILTELESLGFGIGTYGPGVDCRELSNKALLELRSLSFLSVNISGVYAQVVVREASPEPELEDRSAAADVVAATDGVIVDLNTVTGVPAVEEGAAVLEGEVLISGLETYESGDGSGAVLSSRTVHAEGEVWARTRRVLQAATPLTAGARGSEGQKKAVYSLKILKRSIKFYSDSSIFDATCDKIKNTYALTLPGGTVLPLAWEKTTLTAAPRIEAKIDRDSAETYLDSRLRERLSALLGKDGQALSVDVTYSQENEVLTATLRASCLEQIGKTVELNQSAQ